MNCKKQKIRIFDILIINILLLFATAPVWAQHTGADSISQARIVFSAQKITNENYGPHLLQNDFDATDQIYGRIFLKKPLAQYFRDFDWDYDFNRKIDSYNRAIDIYVDGKKVIQWLDELPQAAFRNFDYLDMVILPAQDKKYNYSMSVSDWLNVVKQLAPGRHQVTVKMRAMTPVYPGFSKDPLSTGSFTLNVSDAGKQKLSDEYTIGMPEATIESKDLEEQIILASQDLYPGLIPLKAVIIEPSGDFKYTRDRQGNVLNRYFTAAVAYRGFGDQCYVRSAVYIQKHRGYGEYDMVRMSRSLDDAYNYRIPCGNLNR